MILNFFVLSYYTSGNLFVNLLHVTKIVSLWIEMSEKNFRNVRKRSMTNIVQ